MNKILITFLFLFVSLPLYAQSEFPWQMPVASDYPEIPRFGRSVSSFVPSGFKVFKSASGDLNEDGHKDAALVVIGTSEKFLYNSKDGWVKDFDTNPRILLILFKEPKNGGYKLIAQNNSYIPSQDSPSQSEPLQNLSIRRGVLRLDFEIWYSMGSWGATNSNHKFRYQNGEFFLIGADREDYMRNDSTTNISSYNFSTMRVKRVEKTRENLDSRPAFRKPIITWERIRNSKIRRLSELGQAFSWEIEKDAFI